MACVRGYILRPNCNNSEINKKNKKEKQLIDYRTVSEAGTTKLLVLIGVSTNSAYAKNK